MPCSNFCDTIWPFHEKCKSEDFFCFLFQEYGFLLFLRFCRKNHVDNSRVYSYKLNPVLSGEVSELVEGARLETVCGVMRHRGFESLPLRHSWKATGSAMKGGPLLPRYLRSICSPCTENDHIVLDVHKSTSGGASYG